MVMSYIVAYGVWCISFYDLYTVQKHAKSTAHPSRRRLSLSIQPLAVQGLLLACNRFDEDSRTVTLAWVAVTAMLTTSIWWNLCTNVFVRMQLVLVLFALVVVIAAPYTSIYAEMEASTLGAVGVLLVYVWTRKKAGQPIVIIRQPSRAFHQRSRSKVVTISSRPMSRKTVRIHPPVCAVVVQRNTTATFDRRSVRHQRTFRPPQTRLS